MLLRALMQRRAVVHKKNKRFFAGIADTMFNFCRHKKIITRTNFPPLSVDISFSGLNGFVIRMLELLLFPDLPLAAFVLPYPLPV